MDHLAVNADVSGKPAELSTSPEAKLPNGIYTRRRPMDHKLAFHFISRDATGSIIWIEDIDHPERLPLAKKRKRKLTVALEAELRPISEGSTENTLYKKTEGEVKPIEAVGEKREIINADTRTLEQMSQDAQEEAQERFEHLLQNPDAEV